MREAYRVESRTSPTPLCIVASSYDQMSVVHCCTLLLLQHIHSVVWLQEWEEWNRSSETVIPNGLQVRKSHLELSMGVEEEES